MLAPALAAAAVLVAVDADPRWCWAVAAAVLLALLADGWRGLLSALLAVAVIGGGHAWQLAEARRVDARVLGADGRADLHLEGSLPVVFTAAMRSSATRNSATPNPSRTYARS